MAWDFSTDPEFQRHLDWIRAFRVEQIEPLDLLHPKLAYHPLEGDLRRLVESLKQQVRDRGLWAAHLGPELGGQGFGQLKLGLINEILGGSNWAPIIFGTQAPDTGNAEIIAHYGTEEQKARYLQPLLEGECFSCFSMTEPHGGADPKLFTTRAVRDGDEWVINGSKYYSSNARTSQFVIVMAVSNPEAGPYKGMSMFLVPSDTPGIEIERHIGMLGEAEDEGMHALINYKNVRVPADNLLGGEGNAFKVSQTRLGGGRVHHAMRSVGVCQRALDMMCERVLSRETQGTLLADKQMVQSDIAESYAQLEMFRLLVLKTAWQIDQYHDYGRVRKDISAIKFMMPKVVQDIVYRSMHVHGALGVSNEMPFDEMWKYGATMAVVDGPTEVHKVTVAKEVLKGYQPAPGDWPTQFLPERREHARQVLAERIEHLVANNSFEMGDEMDDEANTDDRAEGMIDGARLGRWMDAAGLPGEGEPSVRHLSGGASNEIFEIVWGDRRMALRRPPRNVPKGRNETMLREYRILHALNGTDVPHPNAVAVCDDEEVMGSAFYLMDFVEGWTAMQLPRWPDPFEDDLEARAGLAYALVDGIAKLGNVDWKGQGLEGLGKPDGFHERQVDRWMSQWSGYKFRELPGLDEAAEFLRSYTPSSYRPGIMHGDYQFANVMFEHGGPARLAAIVDFEMGTIGDPLLDLAWVLMSWPNADEDRSVKSYVDYAGMPDREDLLEYYATHSGRPVDEIDYYLVLANFKMAIVLEGGYARVAKGESDNPKMAFFGDVALSNARKAGELVGRTTLRPG